MAKLYDFQNKGVDVALSAISKNKNPLISSPTGTGKSLIEIEILRKVNHIGLIAYIISSKQEILWGIQEKAEKMFGITLVNQLWTPHTLLNRLESKGRHKATKPDLIVVDEAHHFKAEGWSKLRNLCRVIGLTATPLRGIENEIISWKSLFQEFYQCISIVEAVRKRILVPFYIVKKHINKISIGDSSSLHIADIADEYINNNLDQIYEDILRTEMKYPRPTIIITPSLDITIRLQSYFQGKGLSVFAVTGNTSKAKRIRYFKSLANSTPEKPFWLVSKDILTEGIDIPEISRIIFLYPTRSCVFYVQGIGRGLRPIRDQYGNITNAKVDCEILDYTDNITRFSKKLKDTLGIDLVESYIDEERVLIPNLTEIYKPVNEYKSLKFSGVSVNKKYKLQLFNSPFEIELFVLEIQYGKKRWLIKVKEKINTRYYYLERIKNSCFWIEVPINGIHSFFKEKMDFYINTESLNNQFYTMLNELLNKYSKNYITVGLLLGMIFLEGVNEKIGILSAKGVKNYLSLVGENIEIDDKWETWLSLIPKPTETESIFFDTNK